MSRTDDKYLKQLQARYRKASKKKSRTLDEFVRTTACHRQHATALPGATNAGRSGEQSPAAARLAPSPAACVRRKGVRRRNPSAG